MPHVARNGYIRTLVIDAGHGGRDPGALGKTYKEKDITLKVARKLTLLLRENMPEMEVILTRNGDQFVSLDKRGQIAQDHKADFFISIHCNALDNPRYFGATTYILGINDRQSRYRSYVRENQSVILEKDYAKTYEGFEPNSPEANILYSVMKNAFRKEASNMASKIQSEFSNRLKRHDIGVKQAPFIVLWRSGVPSVLVETGFITNRSEESYLGSETGQTYMASALYRAIRDYNHELGR